MNAPPARRGSRFLPLLAVAVLLPAVAAHAEERAAPPAPPGTAGTLEPGGAAPDFTLRDLSGGLFRFAEENAGKPVLLLFWSVFCEPCRLEMPLLQKLHDRHRDGGLSVVAVALDGEPLKGAVEGVVRQEGWTFRVLVDETDARDAYRAADPYGVQWIPTLFLVEKGGKIALVKTGRVREEDLEKPVQSLLKR